MAEEPEDKINEAGGCHCGGSCGGSCGNCGCSIKVATIYLAPRILPESLYKFAAKYEGNMGIMEMMKFYQVATPDQKKKLEDLIHTEQNKDAWEYLQEVTGMGLEDVGYENKPGNPPAYDWNGFLADKFGPNWRTEAKVPNPSSVGKILKKEVLLTTALKNDRFYKSLQKEYVRWKGESKKSPKASAVWVQHRWYERVRNRQGNIVPVTENDR